MRSGGLITGSWTHIPSDKLWPLLHGYCVENCSISTYASFGQMFITPVNVSLNPYTNRFQIHPFRLTSILTENSRYSLKGPERLSPCCGSASTAASDSLDTHSPPLQVNMAQIIPSKIPSSSTWRQRCNQNQYQEYWLRLCKGFLCAFHENITRFISPLPGKLSSLIYQGIIIPSLHSFAQAFRKTGWQFKVHLIYALSKRKSLSQKNYVSLHVSKRSISIIQEWQAVSFPVRFPTALGLAHSLPV